MELFKEKNKTNTTTIIYTAPKGALGESCKNISITTSIPIEHHKIGIMVCYQKKLIIQSGNFPKPNSNGYHYYFCFYIIMGVNQSQAIKFCLIIYLT